MSTASLRGTIERYRLPDGEVWRDIDAVPEDICSIVGLQQMARSSERSIEEVRYLRPKTIDEINDVMDEWGPDQRIVIARDEERQITGMLSYYYTSTGVPFFESVAVKPSAQRSGTGRTLIDTMLAHIKAESSQPYVKARAQARVVDIYVRGWGARVLHTDPKTGQSEIVIDL